VHFGKTKTGESFEKFLGNSDYDEHVLRPFEKFLHASFSKYRDKHFRLNLSFVDKEDCIARALPKETERGTERGTSFDVESEDGDEEMGEEVGGQLFDYAQIRAKNIAENKLILETLFPQKREKQSLISGFFSKPLLPATSSGSANKNDQIPVKSGSESPSIDTSRANVHKDFQTVNLPDADPHNIHEDSLNADAVGSTPNKNDQIPEKSVSELPSIDTSPANAHEDFQAVIIHEDSPKDDAVDSTLNGTALSTVNVAVSSADVDMADTTTKDLPTDVTLAKGTRVLEKDDSLPRWLAQMIGYLREVSEDEAWQDLVTEYVQFEKSGPPFGVMFPISVRFCILIDDTPLRKCQQNSDQRKFRPGFGAKRRLSHQPSIRTYMEHSLWRGGKGCSQSGGLL
jgi:hypothetical protein